MRGMSARDFIHYKDRLAKTKAASDAQDERMRKIASAAGITLEQLRNLEMTQKDAVILANRHAQ